MKKAKLAAALGAGMLTISGTIMVAHSLASATPAVPARTEAQAIVPVTEEPRAPSSVAFTLMIAPQGNSARYLVQEQLVGFDLPSEAIGETRSVTGSIAFDSSGRIIPDASRIQVGVASLRSDSERRDGFVRARVLETDRHPDVVFVPTSVQGLTLPLATSGTRSFTLSGNLTIRGVTRPVAWHVNATFTPGTIKGTGSTKFAFADFGLTQPRVPVVLSVADTIRLEHQFTLTR